ncbi:C-type lectin domain family 7 member A-like isoform X2 [Poecilia reticulata]|uniref:C-type lectin domain family 7 member A-like isoform X2 n=1 Tax=Poecilia reticulata TaxID=8081 RepID=UPI0007EB2923|nr:PREDICTED: C-type lectin domain family 7 member A-like isoform X2 [Poecilia reticulata]
MKPGSGSGRVLGGKPEGAASERGTGTRTGTRTGTGSCSKVFLGLLSFVLLTSVVAVGFLYQRDFSQLSRQLANQTAERSQLLLRQQNLTNQRDRLDARLKAAELDLDRMRSGSVFCPAGWRRFGCSCYLLSSSMSSWEGSRAQCLLTGADLVTISSQEEMEFLDQLGAQLKVWIGLKEASRGSGWKWTDGSSPGVTFWTRQTSWTSRTQSCAAFNRGSRSWSEEWCSQLLRSVVCSSSSSGFLHVLSASLKNQNHAPSGHFTHKHLFLFGHHRRKKRFVQKMHGENSGRTLNESLLGVF